MKQAGSLKLWREGVGGWRCSKRNVVVVLGRSLPYNNARQASTMLTLFDTNIGIESIYIIKIVLIFTPSLHCIYMVGVIPMFMLLLSLVVASSVSILKPLLPPPPPTAPAII